MRAEVDVSPPYRHPDSRTMGMALEGLRDLSVIATAPQRRQPSKPLCAAKEKGDPRAVMRELQRGGQVYFLHNSTVH